MFTPTEQHLRIPAAMARKYAARGHALGLHVEELESIGNEALVEAMHRFDPEKSPQGEAGFGGFAVQRVKWRLHRVLFHQTEQQRADCRVGSLEGGSLVEVLADSSPDPGARSAASDEVEACLRRLRPRERAMVRLWRMEGLTLEEVARRFAISTERVRQIVERAEERLRRSRRTKDGHEAAGYRCNGSAGLARWRAENPDEAARHYLKARAKGILSCRARRTAHQAAGAIHAPEWYLVDASTRTAWGGWLIQEEAWAAVGVRVRSSKMRGPAPHVSSVLGWPDISAMEAVALDALARRGPGNYLQICEWAKRGPGTIRTVLADLVTAGLALSTGRQGKGRFATYAISDKALAMREAQTSLRPMRGGELMKLQVSERWTVLPPHMAPKVTERSDES